MYMGFKMLIKISKLKHGLLPCHIVVVISLTSSTKLLKCRSIYTHLSHVLLLVFLHNFYFFTLLYLEQPNKLMMIILKEKNKNDHSIFPKQSAPNFIPSLVKGVLF